MIRSLILSTAARTLLPLLLLYSLFLLLRGHNEPGGGFVGGLVAAAGFTLYALAYGVVAARSKLHLNPRTLVAAGLLTAVGSGCVPLLAGRPFLTGLWVENHLPVVGAFGTPLLFDSGVYLTVAGMALLIVFSLMEE
jgi:multicomponent Na+:H+ antiporter subunit B